MQYFKAIYLQINGSISFSIKNIDGNVLLYPIFACTCVYVLYYAFYSALLNI